jgi:hypothetical protein
LGNDLLSIKRNSGGMVTIANNEIKTGGTCVIYVDEGVLGETFGKELRKFFIGSDFENCVVVDKAKYSKVSKTNTGLPALIILSGITVDQIGAEKSDAKYVLLNPAFLPRDMPAGSVQAIVYPEINLRRYFEPEASRMDKFQSKIHKIPFDENFATSWAEYINH